MDKLPISKRKSSSSIDKYRNDIIDNIDKKVTDIYKIIKGKGYKGTLSNLRSYIRSRNLKVSNANKNIFVNRTNIIDLLYHKSISDLMLNKDEEEHLKQLLKKDKHISKIIEISDEFSIALFSGDSHKLDMWIAKAKDLNISELNTFISSLELDIEAAKNSITYKDLSNGPTEGKNCKMKMVKRIMFGRCSPRLLRAKLLQLG